MKRSTYNGYENGVGEPGIDKLVALAKYFGISLDVLVKTDLRLLSDLEYQQLRQPETENKDSATMMRILREG
jgi:transcriptional regulator with XRE-family HTH domain